MRKRDRSNTDLELRCVQEQLTAVSGPDIDSIDLVGRATLCLQKQLRRSSSDAVVCPAHSVLCSLKTLDTCQVRGVEHLSTVVWMVVESERLLLSDNELTFCRGRSHSLALCKVQLLRRWSQSCLRRCPSRWACHKQGSTSRTMQTVVVSRLWATA